MTERESGNLIEILRQRFGPRHPGAMDRGRADIVQALRDELQIGAADAEAMVQRLVEQGQLRYVTSDERDPGDTSAPADDRAERAGTGAGGVTPVAPPISANVPVAPAVTGAAPVAPVAAGGTTSTAQPPLVPASVDDDDAARAGGQGVGYWDIGGQAAGVVPSATRKGQVEPRGA